MSRRTLKLPSGQVQHYATRGTKRDAQQVVRRTEESFKPVKSSANKEIGPMKHHASHTRTHHHHTNKHKSGASHAHASHTDSHHSQMHSAHNEPKHNSAMGGGNYPRASEPKHTK